MAAQELMIITDDEKDAPFFAHPAAEPRLAPKHMTVSVVIVTWNSEGWIERCIRSIEAASSARSFEIIVYDNASGDGTLEIVQSLNDQNVRIVRSSRNWGFAGGINRAVAEAQGEYVFLLNPDCELGPGSLDRLVSHLEEHQNAGAAVPLLLDENGEPQREFQLRRLPTLKSLVAEILLVKEIFPRNPVSAGYRYRDLDISRTQPVEQPAAAALLIRRSVLQSVGPFDESFAPAWFEDVDYCRRLAGSGDRIDLVPTAVATHYGGASLEHVRYQDFLAVWYRNLYRYASKWMKIEEVEALRWTIIAGMLLRTAAATVGLRNPRMNGGSARGYLAIARQAFNRWGNERPRPAGEQDPF